MWCFKNFSDTSTGLAEIRVWQGKKANLPLTRKLEVAPSSNKFRHFNGCQIMSSSWIRHSMKHYLPTSIPVCTRSFRLYQVPYLESYSFQEHPPEVVWCSNTSPRLCFTMLP
jgi:hypothetical protein